MFVNLFSFSINYSETTKQNLLLLNNIHTRVMMMKMTSEKKSVLEQVQQNSLSMNMPQRRRKRNARSLLEKLERRLLKVCVIVCI